MPETFTSTSGAPIGPARALTDTYLKPPEQSKTGWYWLTYRSCDNAPGFGWEHPDKRFCYCWSPEWLAWTSDGSNYFMMHPNQGWRIERKANRNDLEAKWFISEKRED
jgi:hypothetical protein